VKKEMPTGRKRDSHLKVAPKNSFRISLKKWEYLK
jgi:hypothetical protein